MLLLLKKLIKIKLGGQTMKNSFMNLKSVRSKLIVSITFVSILLLVGITIAQTVKNVNRFDTVKTEKDILVEKIEKSPDFSIKIQQDDDAPLKILEAKVKEIPSQDFEKLTSVKSNNQSVISAPTVKMLNVSDKTISRVMLVVNDPVTAHTKGIAMRGLRILPGATFEIVPGNFVKGESFTTVDENGKVNTSFREAMESNKFWLPFSDKTQIQVRVGVEFEDGSEWFNQNQRGGGE